MGQVNIRSFNPVGRSQIGMDDLQVSGDYAYINVMKGAQEWQTSGITGSPDPDKLNVNGYPIDSTYFSGSYTNIYTVGYLPVYSSRPGNWLIKWKGEGTLSQLFGTLSSGSLSGVDGRAVIDISGSTPDPTYGAIRYLVAITAINVSNPITNLVLIHEDDESAFGTLNADGSNTGTKFLTAYKDKIRSLGFNVLRFMGVQYMNTSMLTQWSDRKPVNYFSARSAEFRSSIWGGTTTKVGTAYSLAYGSFSLSDSAMVLLKFNTSGAIGDTLNINGTGDKPLLTPWGDTPAMGYNFEPAANGYACVVYDANLGGYMKFGGDVAYGTRFLDNGMPIEDMVQLCNEMNVNPWFCIPNICLEKHSDFTTQLATYCKNNLNSGLVPRFETSNEIWNFSAGFFASPYGNIQAVQRWGAGKNFNDWVGRVASLMGQDLSSVYSADRARYQAVIGVQTEGSPLSAPERMESTAYVGTGGSAAYNWITRVCLTNYWNTSYGSPPHQGTSAELGDAYTYSVSPSSALVDGAFANMTGAELNTFIVPWVTWAAGYGSTVNFYEGGFGWNRNLSDIFALIHAASKAAQCVLQIDTASYMIPVVGMPITITGAVGMTSLNGGPYTVTNVALHSGTIYDVTINLNSSGFSGTYTADSATGTYTGSGVWIDDFRLAERGSSRLNTLTLAIYNNAVSAGAAYPSGLQLAGKGSPWSMLDPDIYTSTPSPATTAIQTFNS